MWATGITVEYSTNLTISRNAAETLIKQGEVTILLDWNITNNNNNENTQVPIVYAVHAQEETTITSQTDWTIRHVDRRIDFGNQMMETMLREMELPQNQIDRVLRARVHGRLTHPNSLGFAMVVSDSMIYDMVP